MSLPRGKAWLGCANATETRRRGAALRTWISVVSGHAAAAPSNMMQSAAPHHSITSSAATSRPGRHAEAQRARGFQIDDGCILVGACTGSSAAFFSAQDAIDV